MTQELDRVFDVATRVVWRSAIGSGNIVGTRSKDFESLDVIEEFNVVIFQRVVPGRGLIESDRDSEIVAHEA